MFATADSPDVALMASSSSSPFASSGMAHSVVQAHVTQFRLLLTSWITHFKSLGYMKEKTMDMLDRMVAHRIKRLTIRDIKTRYVCSSSPITRNEEKTQTLYD